MVISIEDIKSGLAVIKKNRSWLAKQINYSENTVRQYLGPNGKRTDEFLKAASDVIKAEEFRQKSGKPETPPWNLIFLSEDEFDRADRASRIVKAESLKDFCRNAILEKADELLLKKERSNYKGLQPVPSAKVAETPPKQP